MSLEFLALVWTAALVLGWVLGRYERRRVERLCDEQTETMVEAHFREAMDAYDPQEHRVNFDRLNQQPPRQI